MAFPTRDSFIREVFAGNTTAHLVDMPATVDSGDLLLVFFTNDGGGRTVTTPVGWTELFSEGFGAGSAGVLHSAFYKIAAGTEGGTTVDFVTSHTETAIAHTLRVTSWHGTTPPESGTPAEATSTTPDPPNFNPDGWDAEDTLWIATFGADDSGNGSVSDFPDNYTIDNVSDFANEFSSSCLAAAAIRELNATSDDPNTFTKNASNEWVSNLTAVRPAAAAGLSIPVAMHEYRQRHQSFV